MLVDYDIEPKLNIYFLGAEIIKLLVKYHSLDIKEIQNKLSQKISVDVSIEYVYLTLDWLFLVSNININKNRIEYENR
jgi:hypothetical protein